MIMVIVMILVWGSFDSDAGLSNVGKGDDDGAVRRRMMRMRMMLVSIVVWSTFRGICFIFNYKVCSYEDMDGDDDDDDVGNDDDDDNNVGNYEQ